MKLHLACGISNIGVTVGVTIVHHLFGDLHGRLGALDCADANSLRVAIRVPSTSLAYYNIALII